MSEPVHSNTSVHFMLGATGCLYCRYSERKKEKENKEHSQMGEAAVDGQLEDPTRNAYR